LPRARRRARRSASSTLSQLRTQLEEAQQTLEAIRSGGVDALVVTTTAGEQVFGLRTPDHAYRRIIESIHEGAATLTDEGTVFYANRYLADLLETPLQRLIGSSFGTWLADGAVFGALLRELESGVGHREAQLRASNGGLVPVYIALSRLSGEDGPGLCLVVTDLRAQKRTQELVASEELSRSILEQAADAIVVCDPGGRIVRASEAAKRLCAPSPLGRDFASAFGVPLPSGPTDVEETVVRCGDEPRATMLMSARPLVGREGPVGTVVTLTDISARKRTEEIERHAREAAEAANRSKDEFLAMLAHELRNPLFAVCNALEVARKSEENREPALAIATRQADQLGRLVDDLLDVARIQSGKIELRRETIELVKVLERALDAVRIELETRGHHLEFRRETQLAVDGDEARLAQVFGNLLSNAVKYTPSGGRIEVTARHEGQEAVVRVRDDGTGIAPELLPRVFELFTQGSQGLDRAVGGLGIGLTVTRRLVELHGGRVEARSAGVGLGAEFEVRLPLSEQAPRVPKRLRRKEAVSGTSARILLVEDNADAAEALSMLLEALGHQVCAVGDAAAALDAARADPPDVALVDIGLPGVDGYELAHRLRELDSSSRTRLVALTGYGLPKDKRRAAAAGFHAHLVKPIDLDELQRVLELPRR
jgi:signal transduction histidine kinase/CheY-like chemotaxis protein